MGSPPTTAGRRARASKPCAPLGSMPTTLMSSGESAPSSRCSYGRTCPTFRWANIGNPLPTERICSTCSPGASLYFGVFAELNLTGEDRWRHLLSAASAPPLAPGDYLLALARPQDLVLLDRLFGPRPERSRADERGLLGEFSFEGTTALAAIAHLYDPAAEAKGALTLAEFLASRFDGRPAIGDRTRFGAVELIVRDMQGDAITQVGVELDPALKP